ncbi:DUF2277 family protein [Micromonospora costi]|uniref:DUF2277 family protein n=1 Tax=Micromonospora costi TaxID=1530042 RepID=A0A3B0ABM0_9ACTN|nr:DUF2277 family protein [Micromonospora costi]RKN57831.1 DUF2277 family protein [Micromonospora costi]
MCRSIKTLREPYTPQVTDDDVRAAALQYVRKISGFRAPAAHNAAAFEAAVAAVAEATRTLLDQLVVRGGAAGPAAVGAGASGAGQAAASAGATVSGAQRER